MRPIVHRYVSLPSTNQTAMELAKAGAPEGTTIIAEEQTAGRGRRNRQWFSPRGQGLYLSVILRPSISPERSPLIGLLAAVALNDTLLSAYEIKSDIKWPNDILINGRKCAGILMEMGSTEMKVEFVVMGIGVNLNQPGFPPELTDRATSLMLETSRSYDLEAFRQHLFDRLASVYEAFHASGPSWAIDAWTRRSSYAEGRSVLVDLGDREIAGVTVGLREDGALLLRTVGGRVEAVIAGDTVGCSDPRS